jgi:hypothetical protein
VVTEMSKFGIRPSEVVGHVFDPPPGVDPDELPAGEYEFDLNAVQYAERVGNAQVLSFLWSCSSSADG